MPLHWNLYIKHTNISMQDEGFVYFKNLTRRTDLII